MAKRFTDTEKWKKKWFRKLNPEHKCFWEYLRDNCNHAGIWDVDFETASFLIGVDIDEDEARKVFKKKIVEIDNSEKWFIPSFINFQYGEQLVEANRMHVPIINRLKCYNLIHYFNVVQVGNTKGALRARITKKVREKVFVDDEFICQYCQEQKRVNELVVDHFIPLEKGGDSSDRNLITSCVRCNSHKSDLLPSDFLSRNHIFLKPTLRIKALEAPNKKLQGASKKLQGAKEQEQYKYKEIVSFLNIKTKSNYKPTNEKTKNLIRTRIDEGFVLNDFKKVIENKTEDWQGTDYEQYLRPITLFGSKFEGYLNRKNGIKEDIDWSHD